MLFGATLKNNTPIYRNWRSQSLLTGHLEGVPFRFTGTQYVVDQVPGDKVKALMVHTNVVVHIIAQAPIVAQPTELVDVPDDEPEAAPAPKPRGRPPLTRK